MASGVTLKMRAIKALPPEVVSQGNQAHYHAQAGQVRVHATTPDPALFRDRHRVAVRQMRAAREIELQGVRGWVRAPWSDGNRSLDSDREMLIAAVRRGAVAPDGPAQRRRARQAAWASWGQDHELR